MAKSEYGRQCWKIRLSDLELSSQGHALLQGPALPGVPGARQEPTHGAVVVVVGGIPQPGPGAENGGKKPSNSTPSPGSARPQAVPWPYAPFV